MDIALKDVNVEPFKRGEYWIMAIKAVERQRKEAIRLDRRLEDIFEKELVSEDEYKLGENSGAKGDGDNDISIFD
jgi:hypothetical protein